MTTEQPGDAERRLTRSTVTWIVIWGILATAAGYLAGSGFTRAFGDDVCGAELRCGGLGTAGFLVAGLVLWPVFVLAGMLAGWSEEGALGTAEVAGRAVLAGYTGLGLLGASLSAGGPYPWPALAALPFLPLARWADRWGVRRQRADRLEKERRAAMTELLDGQGVTVTGTVAAIRHTGHTYNDRPELDLTVEYVIDDGSTLRTTHTDTFEAFEMPRVGIAVDVAYDPEAPATCRVTVPTGTPAEPAAVLAESLERLAALHREGGLTAEEFDLAKARVLGGRTAGTPADGS
ncbi:hypothetical protein ACWEQL_05685 [Kitasatospora sp. NPDC004240]